MNILLIDLILGDHSIPFASNIKQGLETRDGISNVDFLTLEPDERIENYFTPGNDIYYLRQNHVLPDGSAEYSTSIINEFVEMVNFINQRCYDAIHFLQIDNLLLESAIVLPDTSGLPPTVAHINGAFFGFFDGDRHKITSTFCQYASKLLSSPLDWVVETILAWNKLSALVCDISLQRCVQSGVFDQFLVHTNAAKEYILESFPSTTPISIVPEPSTVEPPDISQEMARQKLGLESKETVLLFFGGLRQEKGIYQLLESMQQYAGPEFTLLIAGPEKSINKKEILEIKNNIAPSLSLHIRYIYDSEQYFIASDGVLCPYLETFGVERTSHVFQEAIRLQRPVICPRFGSFESRLNNYNLGMLYAPNTAEALTKAVHNFVQNPEQWYSSGDMIRFYEKHSFENLCSTLLKIYQRVS